MKPASWLLATGLWLCAGRAGAYTRAVGSVSQRPVRWEQSPIELRISEPSLPPGVSLAQATTALTSAVDVWKRGAACAPLAFVVGKTDEDAVADDGVNVVVFRRRAWCKNGVERVGGCYDPRRAAVTTLHFAGNAEHERIVGADIELNAVGFDFQAAPSAIGASPKLDLSATLAHELGHVLGFGHPCAAPGERKRSFVDQRGAPLLPCDEQTLTRADSLLSPSAESRSFGSRLGPDDARGVCDVYAAPPPTPKVTSSSCGCDFRARRRAAWSPLSFACLALSWAFRRARAVA